MVKLTGVSKNYIRGKNTVAALSGIDLSVKPGEFMSVTGPSGSGKTTLMNILGCLDYPSSGEYFLAGTMITPRLGGIEKLRNRTIGFVFQNFNLLSHLNAEENVALPLMLRGVGAAERREFSREVLSKVGLSHRSGHYPRELSGGQQQRVAIARALVGEPSLILADEPTGNLDRPSGMDIMKLLCDINTEGKTLIIITHDETVAGFAGRRAVISGGHLYEHI